MLKITRIILKGFVLGLAIMLPGISGGTIAFIIGIYEKLIEEISKLKVRDIKRFIPLISWNKKQIKKTVLFFKKNWDWNFLIPLVFGVVCSMALFVVFASPIINQYSLPFYSLIFGFVLASVSKPLKDMKKTAKNFLLMGISFVINFVLFAFMQENAFAFSGNLNPLFMLPIGFFISMTLIVPGISGSYLLLIFGLYEKTLLNLRDGNFFIICYFLTGAVLGVIFTARWIRYLIKNYFHETIALILGLILSSLYTIYPLPKESFSELLAFDEQKKTFLIFFISSFLLLMCLDAFYNTKESSLKKP